MRFICKRARNKINWSPICIGNVMHTALICQDHLNLELPLEYVCESFKTHGVDASLLNQVLKLYETYPNTTLIKDVYWSALEKNFLAPNCTLAALISVPFLIRNNPCFDPSATPLWPVLVSVFNGCFPFRTPLSIDGSLRISLNGMNEKPTPQQNLHVCILSAMLCCPLNKKTLERLNTDVFSQWNGKQWEDFFNIFRQWAANPDFVNDFKTITKNISQCTSNNHIDFWVQLGCGAMVHGNTDLAAKISQHFKKSIETYLHDNMEIALVPHLMNIQGRSEASRSYKIWMVAFWLGSHQPSLWKNEGFCKIVMRSASRFLGGVSRSARSEDQEISPEFKEFKSSQECSVLENVFQCMGPEIVHPIFINMENEAYTRPKDALECMLMLEYDIQSILPYCKGVDFSEHPLSLAHYQAYVLTNSVHSALQKAPDLEKKI